ADETPRIGRLARGKALSIVMASLILSCIFLSGFVTSLVKEFKPVQGAEDFSSVGYYMNYGFVVVSAALRSIFNILKPIISDTPSDSVLYIFLLAYAAPIVAIPLLPAVVIYRLLRATTPLRLSAAALSARLWGVVAGLCLVVALNFLSLWIEQHPWAPSWAR